MEKQNVYAGEEMSDTCQMMIIENLKKYKIYVPKNNHKSCQACGEKLDVEEGSYYCDVCKNS